MNFFFFLTARGHFLRETRGGSVHSFELSTTERHSVHRFLESTFQILFEYRMMLSLTETFCDFDGSCRNAACIRLFAIKFDSFIFLRPLQT